MNRMMRCSEAVGSICQSQGAAKRLRFWIAIVCLTVTGSMLGVAVVLGIQNREDHVLTGQITQTEAQLRALGPGLQILRTMSLGRWRSTLPPTPRSNPC